MGRIKLSSLVVDGGCRMWMWMAQGSMGIQCWQGRHARNMEEIGQLDESTLRKDGGTTLIDP